MPMFKSLNNYYPMAKDTIAKIFRLKKAHVRRTLSYNQIGFLNRCIKEDVIPKGFVIKDKVSTKKTLKVRRILEHTLVKEQVRILHQRRRESQREIDELTKQLIWIIHPVIWIDIRNFLLYWEKLNFDKTKCKLDKKWDLLTRANQRNQHPKLLGTKKDNFVNLSKHVLSVAQQKLLNKGPKFIMSTNRINNLEVATDVELMLYRNRLEDNTIPDIVNLEINKKLKNPINVNSEEKEAFRSLMENEDIIVIKSDKGNKLVVMDKNAYTTKLKNVVDSEDYTLLRDNPAHKIDLDLRKLVAKVSSKTKKEHKIFDNIITHYSRDPSIFGNPKLHKEGFPLRPIISSYNTVLANSAKYLTPILEDLYTDMEGIERSVKNTVEVKEIFGKQTQQSGKFILFSLDVVNMFGSISPETAFEIITNLVKTNRNFKKYTVLAPTVFLGILKLILFNSYFKFEDSYFSQRHGLPMGSPTSPIVAKIVMKDLESKWSQIPNFEKAELLVRYMDDYLGKWNGTEDQLQSLVTELNSCDINIKLTLELECNRSLNYLDATLTREEEGIKFKMYSKEIAANICLPGDAFHDPSVKKSLIIGETIRIRRISDFFQEDIEKLKSKLLENKYSKKEINIGIHIGISKERKREAESNQNQEEGQEKEVKPTLVSTYMGKTTESIKRRLKPLNIRLVNKRQPNIEGKFAAKFKYKTENNKGIVYKIYCECGEYYIGESGFDLEKRSYDHKRDIRTKTLSNALLLHCLETAHKIDWKRSTLLDLEQNQLRRRLKEALLIQNQKPLLNVNSGMKIRGLWKL